MRYDLIPGRIRASDDSVLVIADTPAFMAIEVDLDSKYPGVAGWEVRRDGCVEFRIAHDDDTLFLDEEHDGVTRIVVHGDFRRWHFMTDASRYTWRIVGYMYPP